MGLGKRKVPGAAAAMFLFIAGLLDLLQAGVSFLLPPIDVILNLLIDGIAVMFFSIFLHGLYGVNLWSARNSLKTITTMLVDLIPVPLMGTTWVFYIAYVVFTSREEVKKDERNPAPMMRL